MDNNEEKIYQIGIVYKWCCKDPKVLKYYVGSTVSYQSRISRHQTNYLESVFYKGYQEKLYGYIFDNGGWSNFHFVILEQVNNITRKNLTKIEGKYIKNYRDSLLNIQIPNRTRKEYLEDNKERIYAQNIQSKKRNREKIRQKRKEYYQKNKEVEKVYNKFYYMKNKKKIEEQRKTVYKCICGCEITLKSRCNHIKSNIHKKNMKNIFDNNNIQLIN